MALFIRVFSPVTVVPSPLSSVDGKTKFGPVSFFVELFIRVFSPVTVVPSPLSSVDGKTKFGPVSFFFFFNGKTTVKVK